MKWIVAYKKPGSKEGSNPYDDIKEMVQDFPEVRHFQGILEEFGENIGKIDIKGEGRDISVLRCNL